MCEFISAIVMEDGRIICDPEHTDSHEDLMRAHNIHDGHAQRGRFARVEFTPPSDDIADAEKWNLRVDESETPDWFDSEVVAGKLAAIVRRMIVSDKRDILLGGCWILVGEAHVDIARSARIWAMHGSSRVGTMQGSSRVGTMYDSSQVVAMHDSSQVAAMYDSSRVVAMHGSSQVVAMHDSSQVGRDLRKDEEKVCDDEKRTIS